MVEKNGDSGNDNLGGTAGNDILHGRGGDDTLRGGAGADLLYGGPGDDVLRGGAGADLLHGGAGRDTFYVDSSDSLPDFQVGKDSIVGSYPGGVGGNGAGHDGNGIQWNPADFVPKDWITDPASKPPGTIGPQDGPMPGFLGFDPTLPPGEFSRYLPVYVNNDDVSDGMDVYVLALDSDDAIVGFSKETYVLKEAWDTTPDPSPPIDPYYPSDSVPEYAYAVDTSGMFLVDATTRPSQTPRLDFGSNITEAIFIIEDAQSPAPLLLGGKNNRYSGGSNVDVVYGGGGRDTLAGNAGNDALRGETGDDILRGGEGEDVLLGEAGNDVLWGGDSQDSNTLGVNGPAPFELLNGGTGNDILYGEAGLDILYGMMGDDTIKGGSGLDALVGGSGDDLLSGGAGGSNGFDSTSDFEFLSGGLGDDTLYGGADGDRLLGGAGDDRLDGGSGKDELTGGAGADTFIFFSPDAGMDILSDFDRLQGDKIQISALGFSQFNGFLSPSVDQFTYDSTLGELSFNGIQFADLQPGANFVLGSDLVIAA